MVREKQLQLEKQLQALSEKVEYYQKRLSREHGAKYSLENIIGESPENFAFEKSDPSGGSIIVNRSY